jgi:hypothetical protein
MSLTNSRRVPGSFTRSIIRAASAPTSGTVANSANFTLTTPSVAGMGAGNGSIGCASAGDAIRTAAASMRLMYMMMAA